MNAFAIVRNTVDILKIDWELDFLQVQFVSDFVRLLNFVQDEERKAYYDAFSAFDWTNSGKISHNSLIFAMRRAGINPTEVEVHDIINRHDNGSGVFNFDEFCKVVRKFNTLI